MKQKVLTILLAALALLLVAAAVCMWLLVTDVWQLPAKEVLTPAPDFTMYTADGTAVKLSDYQGKPVVLNFWASWCGPCKSEMPAFEEAYLAVGEDVQFLMVNLTDGTGETVETASAFIAESGYTFPVLFDSDYAGSTAYAVSSIPATFFLDEKGQLVASHVGAMDAQTLQSYLEQLQ